MITFSLYNQLDALISQKFLFWNKTLHVSDSSSVRHQEFFTVHTAMVYVVQVCCQLASRIRMELLESVHLNIAKHGLVTREIKKINNLLYFSCM